MGAIKRNIPNFITCLNLLSGCIGIILLFNGMPIEAAYAMFIAAIFDFFDGLVARALHVTSPIGRDLDSLADVITFGLLPGLIAMNMVIATQNIDHRWSFICLLIPIFSALRLAIFNNDTQQSYSFKGLATPANGLFWACLSISYFNSYISPYSISSMRYEGMISKHHIDNPSTVAMYIENYPYLIIGAAIILSLLLVSRIDLIAFKLNNFSFKRYMWHFILLILSVISAIIFGFASAPIILLLYIIISQIHFRTTAHEI